MDGQALAIAVIIQRQPRGAGQPFGGLRVGGRAILRRAIILGRVKIGVRGAARGHVFGFGRDGAKAGSDRGKAGLIVIVIAHRAPPNSSFTRSSAARVGA